VHLGGTAAGHTSWQEDAAPEVQVDPRGSGASWGRKKKKKVKKIVGFDDALNP